MKHAISKIIAKIFFTLVDFAAGGWLSFEVFKADDIPTKAAMCSIVLIIGFVICTLGFIWDGKPSVYYKEEEE